MSEQPEFSPPEDMEEAILVIFPHNHPSPVFIDRLGRQLSAQIEQSITNRRRFQSFVSPLAWGGAVVILILVLILLINNLLPNIEPVQPIAGGVISATSTIIPSPTPDRHTNIGTAASSTATLTPETIFSPDNYPSPSPFIAPVNGLSTGGCPNFEGIEPSSQLSLDEAFLVLQALNSGNLDAMRKVSDPAFWDYFYLPTNGTPVPIEKNWLQVKPASQSEYNIVFEEACGKSIVDASWSVVNCGSPCQVAQSPALFIHYFLINRNGVWLVWASYP